MGDPPKPGSKRYLKRVQLLRLTRGLCYLCRTPLRPLDPDFTRDHVSPKSLGGGAGSNLLPAHSECNLRRGTYPVACCIFTRRTLLLVDDRWTPVDFWPGCGLSGKKRK